MRSTASFFRRVVAAFFLSAFLLGLAVPVTAQDLAPSAQRQISALLAEKASRTPAQAKIDSHLLHAAMVLSGQPLDAALPPLAGELKAVRAGANYMAEVDIRGSVTDGLLGAVRAAGGRVISSFPEYESVRAMLPLTQIENIAARAEVRQIRRAARARLNGIIGLATVRERLAAYKSRQAALPALTVRGLIQDLNNAFQAATNAASQPQAANLWGDKAHAADAVRQTFGFDGAGVKVGVLSNGVDSLASEQTAGRLPSPVTVVPGQERDPSGVMCTDGAAKNACDEGTAMLEIIHALAPGASLYFATGVGGQAQMAANIQALKNYGCSLIVDDISFSDEAVFQDDVLAKAINTVTAGGALYFSSAGNSGNLLNGKSGTWRGDFNDSGQVFSATVGGRTVSGNLHSFGATNYDQLTSLGDWVDLQWSDPLRGSNNDYDLFILNSTGAQVVASSVNTQNGSQDPEEFIPYEDYATACSAGGCRIAIISHSSAARRTLYLSTQRGALSIATNGATSGHNAAASALTVGATPVLLSAGTGNAFPYPTKILSYDNVLGYLVSIGYKGAVETFSSDGPRVMYYDSNGAAYTPNNFLMATNGGRTLNKPDFTAADGVQTGIVMTPDYPNNLYSFGGTSAAAPQAAGIAALMLQAKPSMSQADVTASGNMLSIASGWTEYSGNGVLMADRFMNTLCAYSASAPSVAAGGGSYSLSINANAGCTWSVTSANWPSWITMPTRSGSGTASVGFTAAANSRGAPRTATLVVPGATLTITQAAASLTITTASMLSGFVGGAYSQTLTAVGGTAPYTWTVTGLPAGLSASGATVSGSPSVDGTSTVTIQVQDSASPQATASVQLAITIIPGGSGGVLPRAGVIGQIGAGASWDSEIWIVNNSARAVPARVKFYSDDGSAGISNSPYLATVQGVTSNGNALPGAWDIVLPAHGTVTIVTNAASLSTSAQGWAEVQSTGTSLTGFCIFRSLGLGEGITPLQTQSGVTALTMPFDNTANTGLAIGNLGSAGTVTVSAWYLDGTPIPGVSAVQLPYKKGAAQESSTWPANGHDANMLNAWITATAGQRGVIQFQVAGGNLVTGVGLRLNSTADRFTSMPVTLQ